MVRLLLTAAALALALGGVLRLRLETDSLAMLPASVPGVAELRQLTRQMSDERTLLLLLEPAEEGAEVDDDELVALLQTVPGTLRVYSAFDSPALKENFAELTAYLLLNRDPQYFQHLLNRDLVSRLAAARQVAASSLNGMAVAQAGYDPLDFTKQEVLHWAQSGLSRMSEHESGARVLFVEAKPGLAGYRAAAEWIEHLQGALRPYPVKVSFTGSPAFAAEIGMSMEQDMGGTAGLCGGLVVLLFLVFQRSVRQLLALLLCLAFSLVAALGVYGWVQGELGVASAGFAALLIGLTVDYAMIVGREVVATGNIALGKAHSRRGVYCGAATTAAPFLVMMTSIMPGGSQLGLLVACGLVVGAVVMVECYPHLAFSRQAPPAALSVPLPWLGSRYALWVTLVVAALAACTLGYKLPGASLVTDISQMEPQKKQAMLTLLRLQELYPEMSQSTVHLIRSAGGEVDEQKLRAALKEMEQEGLLAEALLPRGEWLPAEQHFQQNVRWLADHPEWLATTQGLLAEAGFTEKAGALARALVSASQRWGVGGAENAFAELKSHPLLASRVMLAGSERGEVGCLRLLRGIDLEVYLKLRGLDQPALRCAAWPLVKYDIGPLLLGEIRYVMLPMGAALLLTLLLALGNWREALLAVALLLLGVLCVGALLLLVRGGELHFLHVLGLILLMGAGLDYELHMIFSLRRQEVPAVQRSTGMAVLYCGLTTMMGFGSLLLASSSAMADLGLLVATGVAIMLVLSTTVLPGLWLCWCQRPAEVCESGSAGA